MVVEVILGGKTRLKHPEFHKNQYRTAAAAKAAAVEAVSAWAPTTPLRLLASPGADGRTGACRPAATELDQAPARKLRVTHDYEAPVHVVSKLLVDVPSDHMERAT